MLISFNAHLIHGQERSCQRDRRCDPTRNHRVTQQGVHGIEETVDDNHGPSNVVVNTHNLLQSRDSSKTCCTHQNSLQALGNLPSVMYERNTDLKYPGRDIRLLRAVLSFHSHKYSPPYKLLFMSFAIYIYSKGGANRKIFSTFCKNFPIC